MRPTNEPTSFRAGLTVEFEKSDFPNYAHADGFTTAIYTISGANGAKEIAGAYSNGVWVFSLSAANNDLAAGSYTLFGYVSDGTNKYEVYSGDVEVKGSLVTASQVDNRSHVKKVLDAIEAVIEKRATKIQESTSLPNGVAISLLSPQDLVKWYENYKYKYAQELDTNRVRNGGTRRKFFTTFI